MGKQKENQQSGIPRQERLSPKDLVPRETWKELGGHSDGKIVKGAAFAALVEVIFPCQPTVGGKMVLQTKH